MNDFLHTHQYIVLSCAKCKVTFAVTEAHFRRLKTTGETFWCPDQVTGLARRPAAFT